MSRLIGLAALAAVAAVLLAVPATGASAQGAEPVIVVLKTGVNSQAVAALHERSYGAQVGFVYEGHALYGYSAVVPAARLAALRADENVAYVEPDGIMSVSAQTLPWGIDKIDADVSSTKAGDGMGAITNVNSYVIDTGIDTAHADLNVVATSTSPRVRTRTATATARTSPAPSARRTTRATSSASPPASRRRASRCSAAAAPARPPA